MSERTVHAGLCVGGPDWPYSEVQGQDAAGRAAFLEQLGEAEATCVARCGGDYLRTLYMTSTVLGAGFHHALYGLDRPVRELTRAQLAEHLARIDRALEDALARVRADELDWSTMDPFFRGVERCNASIGGDQPAVRVLLCLVDFPPRPILEMPAPQALPGFSVTADVLWSKFVHVHIGIMRAIVRRYCAPATGCVGAIEVVNEPDYHWIPDENRIERALRPESYPLAKYLTELHISQIPHSSRPCPSFFQEEGGYYVEQALDPSLGAGDPEPPPVPVLEFRWGQKFDRYVACAADLIQHAAFAARDEAHRAGVPLTVVSGAVTHNNLDYLIRMHRANPEVYRYVDAIGLHPYHWPRHDMHDTGFVSRKSTREWRSASPREFAERYFKRFDFLEEIAALVKSKDAAASHGMAGKSIWITEFGIPTKKAAHANAALAANRSLFIYRRGEPVPHPIHAIVWEDKWDAFFKQVTPGYLRENRVAALLCYTLRGGGMGESTDEEHSNFTLFDADCRTPRMDRDTFGRFTARLGELTGRAPDQEHFSHRPDAERRLKPLGTDWRDVDLDGLPDAPGMTAPDELRFLHWTCATGYEGRGAVVELGAFLGRTTVAMASGLARSKQKGARVVSIDSHVWEPWALAHYGEKAVARLSRAQRAALPADARTPGSGRSFRPLFDLFTTPVTDHVRAISADLDTYEWSGEPIEILFVDAAKSWATLDRIVEQFFPHLVDGATVIHQDYKHFYSWWLHPVTERMIEDGLLEPTVNVLGTPTQAFRFHRPTAFDLGRYVAAAFDADTIDALIEASGTRFAAPESITIAGARVRHLLDAGRADQAHRVFTDSLVAGGFVDDYGLWDLLSLFPDRYVDLRDAIRTADRGAGRALSPEGGRSLAVAIPGEGRAVTLEVPVGAVDAGSRLVMQARTTSGSQAAVQLDVPGQPRVEIEPGHAVMVVAPTTSPGSTLTITLAADGPGTLILVAPMTLS